ncbi:hypothetical protein LUA82_03330 [Neoehrlichia mikurensis]|uniref:Uncharacterized protein n=1 Tax=Neoehrlichia mikurensis TaxID=89586 RepID=A0A9Q9BWF2_9RICK|nr:hypothetical protein [Neoehrlichia mikurensis]UTO55201.1 hypothetical protein LUA82_03330 [Neoehrlichia mikurensis]
MSNIKVNELVDCVQNTEHLTESSFLENLKKGNLYVDHKKIDIQKLEHLLTHNNKSTLPNNSITPLSLLNNIIKNNSIDQGEINPLIIEELVNNCNSNGFKKLILPNIQSCIKYQMSDAKTFEEHKPCIKIHALNKNQARIIHEYGIDIKSQSDECLGSIKVCSQNLLSAKNNKITYQNNIIDIDFSPTLSHLTKNIKPKKSNAITLKIAMPLHLIYKVKDFNIKKQLFTDSITNKFHQNTQLPNHQESNILNIAYKQIKQEHTDEQVQHFQHQGSSNYKHTSIKDHDIYTDINNRLIPQLHSIMSQPIEEKATISQAMSAKNKTIESQNSSTQYGKLMTKKQLSSSPFQPEKTSTENKTIESQNSSTQYGKLITKKQLSSSPFQPEKTSTENKTIEPQNSSTQYGKLITKKQLSSSPFQPEKTSTENKTIESQNSSTQYGKLITKKQLSSSPFQPEKTSTENKTIEPQNSSTQYGKLITKKQLSSSPFQPEKTSTENKPSLQELRKKFISEQLLSTAIKSTNYEPTISQATSAIKWTKSRLNILPTPYSKTTTVYKKITPFSDMTTNNSTAISYNEDMKKVKNTITTNKETENHIINNAVKPTISQATSAIKWTKSRLNILPTPYSKTTTVYKKITPFFDMTTNNSIAISYNEDMKKVKNTITTNKETENHIINNAVKPAISHSTLTKIKTIVPPKPILSTLHQKTISEKVDAAINTSSQHITTSTIAQKILTEEASVDTKHNVDKQSSQSSNNVDKQLSQLSNQASKTTFPDGLIQELQAKQKIFAMRKEASVDTKHNVDKQSSQSSNNVDKQLSQLSNQASKTTFPDGLIQELQAKQKIFAMRKEASVDTKHNVDKQSSQSSNNVDKQLSQLSNQASKTTFPDGLIQELQAKQKIFAMRKEASVDTKHNVDKQLSQLSNQASKTTFPDGLIQELQAKQKIFAMRKEASVDTKHNVDKQSSQSSNNVDKQSSQLSNQASNSIYFQEMIKELKQIRLNFATENKQHFTNPCNKLSAPLVQQYKTKTQQLG